MSEQSSEGLLSRWSRLKREATRQTAEDDPALHGDDGAALDLGVSDGDAKNVDSLEPVASPEVVLTDEDMPPLESLNSDSDFSLFMSPGVSDELRKLALKKLFSAPTFNLRDGLDEYDDDYTSFEKLGDIVTCDMKHQLEMEAKKKLEREAEEGLESQQEAVPVEMDQPENLAAEVNMAEAELTPREPDAPLTDESNAEEIVSSNE